MQRIAIACLAVLLGGGCGWGGEDVVEDVEVSCDGPGGRSGSCNGSEGGLHNDYPKRRTLVAKAVTRTIWWDGHSDVPLGLVHAEVRSLSGPCHLEGQPSCSGNRCKVELVHEGDGCCRAVFDVRTATGTDRVNAYGYGYFTGVASSDDLPGC